MPFNLVLFAFLDGASPWWWVALALAVGAVEVATGTTYLLGPALAALTVAGLLFFSPGLDGTTQITVFAASMLVFTAIAFVLAQRARQRMPADAAGLNRRAAAVEGRTATAIEPFKGDIGSVAIDGIVWRARIMAPRGPVAAGSALRITGIEGATLIVEQIDE